LKTSTVTGLPSRMRPTSRVLSKPGANFEIILWRYAWFKDNQQDFVRGSVPGALP
jgi:hypothetical protein